MSEQIELHKLHFATREKLIYFLLASAGAAIGFAITLRDSLPLEWPSILVILAIGVWAVSFWAGIRAIMNINHFVYANAGYLKAQNEVPVGYHPALFEIATEASFDPIQKRISRWQKLQLYGLVLGALFLMIWRVALAYPDFFPAKLLIQFPAFMQ
ncbi:hypothetical protein GEU84_004535 [Fertoebacter nigrum]|uniref:Uncharacterized protein n=1 Tax=Fertoeibacter niger TaxID=2656921 RepID=A0A8X8H157_9RHOB|nr:hypothetical protein [Fertoeibacter niger]NUB43643.1 hypothetical protein [Fertoeibacter niger]